MVLLDLDNIPESGAVFTIGRSRFADNFASHFFIRQDPVVTIACGDEHSAVVCQSGRLFVFGSNDWGQLGLGHKNHVSKPSCVKILKPEKVTHVACGRAHSLICTGGQKIFTCGSDQEGQLGRGDPALVGGSSSSPVLVHDSGLAGPKIVQMAAGSHHSMALTSDGNVIAWGSNSEGQLGLPDKSGPVSTPTIVPLPEPVKAISVGYYHSAFLTESGLVYVCGESENGKLGIVTNFSTQNSPLQLQLSFPALIVDCGGHHTLIQTDDGTLHCFGSNGRGQLGLGQDVTEAREPKILSSGALQGESVSKISCGESHTAIVTESGKLFTCGDGRHGKLGLEENENNVHELTLASRYQELVITDVSCGGCHTILVGRRREGSMDKSDTDAVIQRKNSLPPLKIPLSRITNEKSDLVDAKNDQEQKGIFLDLENSNDQKNNVEKPEAPRSLTEYIAKTPERNIEVLDTKNNNVGENDHSDKSPNIEDREIDESQTSSEKSEPIETQKSPEKFNPPSLESQSHSVITSDAFLTPPPKPPRQKHFVLEKPETSPKRSPEKRIPSATKGDIEEKNETSINEVMNSQQLVSDSKSRDEIVDNLEDGGSTVLETGKQEIGATQVESEMSQSLAAVKTGKMAKLFKGKKHQEAKITGEVDASNSKSKSKTCTVL